MTKNRFLYIVFFLFLVALWQYLSSVSPTIRFLISSPHLIYEYFKNNTLSLSYDLLVTTIEIVLGFSMAIIISFGMMVLCFYFPKFMDFIMPIVITFQVVPLVVLAPFFVILFGVGMTSKVAMSSIMCVFPIFINFAQGYKSIHQNVHDLVYTYNFSIHQKIYYVYFPLSVPSIFVGLKVGVTLAVIGAIVAEFSGAKSGLGRNLYLSSVRLEPELMFSSLILSVSIGMFLYFLINKIQKTFFLKYE